MSQGITSVSGNPPCGWKRSVAIFGIRSCEAPINSMI